MTIGPCGGATEGYYSLGSVSDYSALAGVLAGVLFTGIVLLVGLGRTNLQQHVEAARRSTLEIMVPNVLVMFVASFMFGLAGGDRVCRRLDFEELVAACLLSTGAAATFQAITWMIHSLEYSNNRLLLVCKLSQVTLAMLGASQIVIVGDDYMQDYSGPGWATAVNYSLGVLAGFAILAGTVGSRSNTDERSGKLAGVVPWALVALLVVAVVTFQIAVYPSGTTWVAPHAMPASAIVGQFLLFIVTYAVVALITSAAPAADRVAYGPSEGRTQSGSSRVTI